MWGSVVLGLSAKGFGFSPLHQNAGIKATCRPATLATSKSALRGRTPSLTLRASRFRLGDEGGQVVPQDSTAAGADNANVPHLPRPPPGLLTLMPYCLRTARQSPGSQGSEPAHHLLYTLDGGEDN